MEPQRFRDKPKPQEVDAVQLPAFPEPGDDYSIQDYLDLCIDIAAWCGGDSHMMLDSDDSDDVITMGIEGPHIAVPGSMSKSPVAARSGDWIVKNAAGFQVVEQQTFADNFESTDEPTCEEKLIQAQEATGRAQREADRLYPGDRPGHDSMG